jgi:hypothetical protein
LVGCGHQIRMDKDIQIQTIEDQDHSNVVVDTRRRSQSRIEQGALVMAKEMNFNLDHNPITDVMFVDLLPLEAGSRVEIIDIGESLGFPGQMQLRVDPERQLLYGITIQNYSGFRRKLLWQYRMWSFRRAIQLLVYTLIAGLGIEQNYRHHQLV